MATPRHALWQNDPAILAASKNAPSLKPGASGTGVARLQAALLLMGAPVNGDGPGQFGAVTKAQLTAFQASYGLTADGIAGAGTIAKLDLLLSTPSMVKPWAKPAFAGTREDFLQKVASDCGPLVRAKGLPVSSMVACAAVESGWGTGPIFKQTRNLFSMQKWPWVQYPTTAQTMWMTTVIATNPVKTARAPFNTALDFADAGRQWCEWVLHYGEADGPPGNIDQHGPRLAHAGAIGRRKRLLALAGDPMAFAANLYLVGFGESHAKGALYARVLAENQLTRFD